MRKPFRSAVFVVLALGFIVICFLVIPKRAARPVLPFPNGYDDFLKAAQNAVSQRWPYGEGSDAELRELVDENRSALELARVGCKRNCRVVIDYSVSAPAYATQHLPVLAKFKKLALDFRSEGELAEREGRTNDAARAYLDGIRFGQEFCRGGLVIDRLVGVACEAIDFGPLSSLVQNLDARTCRQFKKLALDFRSEGELAEREGRTNDALHVYLDGIRFGQEFCREGLVIDRLVGLACEAINFGPLSNLVPQLDARSCREMAQVLETMEAKREPWESTLRVERLYFRNVASLRENLFGTVYRIFRWCQSWWAPVQDPKQKLERVQGWERRLILQVAVRAYELEKGKAPERATELVPEYFKAVPKDPVTGQEMALPR